MTLTIAIAQAHPRLGDVPANVAAIRRLSTEARNRGADLVVFPELMTTGYVFDNRPELEACLSGGNGLAEIAEMSRELSIIIAVGYADVREGVATNRAALFEAGELRADYVKTHLWNTEKELFAAGEALPPVAETSIGRVALAICYDLEFPELYRHFATAGADLIAAPTNWPAGFEAPSHFGPFNGELLRAMAGASANRVFVAIACRTGSERGVDWVDNSCLINPDGYPVTDFIDGEGLILVEADFTQARAKDISPRNNVRSDRRTDLYS